MPTMLGRETPGFFSEPNSRMHAVGTSVRETTSPTLHAYNAVVRNVVVGRETAGLFSEPSSSIAANVEAP